jgi:sulfane dehydrogenase subunit SoxC
MAKANDVDKDKTGTSRRKFLRNGGALVGGTVIAGGLAGSEALATNESPDNLVIKNIPKNLPQYLSASGRTPLQDLDVSSRRTDCSTNAIMAVFLRSIHRSTG